MERRSLLVAWAGLGLALVAGCGAADAPNSTTAASGATADLPAAEVVRQFLEAIRTGNDAQASLMLTETARQETKKHELVVAPPGSDTARFEVGAVEVLEQGQLTHVASKWTDIGEDGQPHTDDIIWALRLDSAGWRIAGMATTLFPNEPPLLLDFEKPEEMMQQQQMAEAELQRRAMAAEGQAGKAAESQATKTTKPADGNVLRQ